jgi:hypothetical protein
MTFVIQQLKNTLTMDKSYHKPIIELRQSLNLLKDQEVITDKVLEHLNNLISNISDNIPTPQDFIESLANQLNDSCISTMTGRTIPCKIGRVHFKNKYYKVTLESF